MKLHKIISGGQSGADRTGLECARMLGLVTGGTAPKGYKVDGGFDPSLKDFGLIEHPSSDYPPRTRENVKNADVTVWFGFTTSAGYHCTKKACLELGKPLILNPHANTMKIIADTYEMVNVAGNRARINPKVVQQVKDAFGGIVP